MYYSGVEEMEEDILSMLDPKYVWRSVRIMDMIDIDRSLVAHTLYSCYIRMDNTSIHVPAMDTTINDKDTIRKVIRRYIYGIQRGDEQLLFVYNPCASSLKISAEVGVVTVATHFTDINTFSILSTKVYPDYITLMGLYPDNVGGIERFAIKYSLGSCIEHIMIPPWLDEINKKNRIYKSPLNADLEDFIPLLELPDVYLSTSMWISDMLQEVHIFMGGKWTALELSQFEKSYTLMPSSIKEEYLLYRNT